MADSPFRSFVGEEPFPIFPGVGLHPIAGDQVFLGKVTYEPCSGTVTSTQNRRCSCSKALS